MFVVNLIDEGDNLEPTFMTTAEAIEGMTDAGVFEILATQVLRLTDPDCKAIEHFGVNAEGKTIPNPVDGFCQVPGSVPPRFVMTTFTTVDTGSLERKWLSDGNPVAEKPGTREKEGDLVKAGRLAVELLRSQPEASVIVYLCTNKRLNEELMAAAYAKAAELKVEVRFLGLSSIRDFLDLKPDGQWLRKVSLRIDANRMSAPLLRDLCKASVTAYGNETLLLSPKQFVPTKQDAQLQDILWNSGKNIVALSGASGSGKSVLAYKALDRALAQGKLGMWIPGAIATSSNSLNEAVQKSLLMHSPNLEPTAGSDALALSSPEIPLLIVIDDINRTGNPSEALRKLIAWSKPGTGSEGSRQQPPWSILCPIWDQFVRARDSVLEHTKEVEVLPISRMDIDEAEACFRSARSPESPQLQTHEIRQLAQQLNCDPILLVMAATNLGSNPRQDAVLAETVIGDWIAEALSDPQFASQFTIADHKQALHRLATEMIERRMMYPTWAEVLLWFASSPDVITSLRELTRHNRICRLTTSDVFEFRHDRILGHYLTQAFKKVIEGELSSTQAWSDPFYRKWLGQAIARVRLVDAKLEQLLAAAPSSLFAALSLFSGLLPEQDQRIDLLCRRWFGEGAPEHRAYPVTAVFNDVCDILEDGTYKDVLRLTEFVKDNPILWRVRMGAGDLRAAIRFLNDRQRFYPHQRDPSLEDLIKRTVERFGPALSRELSDSLLTDKIDSQYLFGVFVLAGYLADESLVPALRFAWSKSEDDHDIVAALWSATRCCRVVSKDFMLELLEAWSIRGKEDRMSIGRWLEYNVIREDTDEKVLDVLFAVARANANIRYPVAWVVQKLDKPSAVCFISEVLGELEGRAKKSNGFHHWGMHFRDVWNMHDGLASNPKRMSRVSQEALHSLWLKSEKDEDVRTAAFETWVKTAASYMQLRLVVNNPGWENTLYWRRARLGDPEVVDIVRNKLSEKPQWIYLVPSVWHPSFIPILDERLANLRDYTPTDYSGGMDDEHYELSNILRDIPHDASEPLLKKHWDFLQYSPRFVQLALYLCTQETVRMAAESIAHCEDKKKLFKYMEHYFGFMTSGLREKITISHLTTLKQWLPLYDNLDISMMVDFCVRNGFFEWAENNLKPECDRRFEEFKSVDAPETEKGLGRLGKVFPKANELLEELDAIEADRKPLRLGAIYVWIDNFSRRPIRQEAHWDALDTWLKQSPTTDRLSIVAQAIEFAGERRHLALLSKYQITGYQEQADELITNATFVVKSRTLN